MPDRFYFPLPVQVVDDWAVVRLPADMLTGVDQLVHLYASVDEVLPPGVRVIAPSPAPAEGAAPPWPPQACG